MRNFALKTFVDQNGKTHVNDIYMLPNGQLALVDEAYDISQSISCSLQLWLGEYDFNNSEGIPYKIILSNPGINQSLIEYQIRKAIFNVNNFMSTETLAIYGVKTIQKLDYYLDRVTRKLNLKTVVLLNSVQEPLTIEVNI